MRRFIVHDADRPLPMLQDVPQDYQPRDGEKVVEVDDITEREYLLAVEQLSDAEEEMYACIRRIAGLRSIGAAP